MAQFLCHAIGEQLPVAGIRKSGPECQRRDRGEQRLEIEFQASAWRPRPGQPGGVRGTVGADVRGRSDVLVALLTFPAADRVDGSTRCAAQQIMPVFCVSRSNKRDRSRCRPGDFGCAGGRRPSRFCGIPMCPALPRRLFGILHCEMQFVAQVGATCHVRHTPFPAWVDVTDA